MKISQVAVDTSISIGEEAVSSSNALAQVSKTGQKLERLVTTLQGISPQGFSSAKSYTEYAYLQPNVVARIRKPDSYFDRSRIEYPEGKGLKDFHSMLNRERCEQQTSRPSDALLLRIEDTFTYQKQVDRLCSKYDINIILKGYEEGIDALIDDIKSDPSVRTQVVIFHYEHFPSHVTPMLLHKPAGKDQLCEALILDSVGGEYGSSSKVDFPSDRLDAPGTNSSLYISGEHSTLLLQMLDKHVKVYYHQAGRQASAVGCGTDALLVARSTLLSLKKTPALGLGQLMKLDECVESHPERVQLLGGQVPLEWIYTSELLKEEDYPSELQNRIICPHSPGLTVAQFRTDNTYRVTIKYTLSRGDYMYVGERDVLRFEYMRRKHAELALKT